MIIKKVWKQKVLKGRLSNCEWCGIGVYETKKSRIRRFCSSSCCGLAKRGQPSSSSTKFKKGVISSNRGKKHSEESISKMRAISIALGCRPPSRKGCIPKNKGVIGWRHSRSFEKGENHWNWKGYNSEEILENKWQRELFRIHISPKVLERDGYVCAWCGEKGGILQSQHIKFLKEYPELRFDINNCITVHRGKCHQNYSNSHKIISRYRNFAMSAEEHADRLADAQSEVMTEDSEDSNGGDA
jgi:hypothetical protein